MFSKGTSRVHFGHVQFKILITYPNGDIKKAVGYESCSRGSSSDMYFYVLRVILYITYYIYIVCVWGGGVVSIYMSFEV